MIPRNTILAGDATRVLAGLPPASVDCVVSSPPYFNLRYYGHQPDQLGLEPTVDKYVEAIRGVCWELARVLKPTGVLWLVLRDSYSRSRTWGAAPKSLLLAPERLLLALQRDGWIVRNRIVWSKPNPMPEQIRDRLSVAHEDVLMLTRKPSYYFDLDAIRVIHKSVTSKPTSTTRSRVRRGLREGKNDGLTRLARQGRVGHPNGKNPGSVWHYATASYRGAHYATFPTGLIERPILASCPERLCATCQTPWKGIYERADGELIRRDYRPACTCRAGFVRGLVLDPFFGTGTTGEVAERHGRDWLGIELNPEYHELAWQRLSASRGGWATARRKEAPSLLSAELNPFTTQEVAP